MSVLEGISEGLQGFTQGAQQGLDIYQQVQQIKDQGDARKRKQLVEQKVGELVKSGAFDPKHGSIAKGLEQGAQIMLEAGDYENFDKWYGQAQQVRKLDGDRFFKMAFSALPTSPQVAIDYLNKSSEAQGLGPQLKMDKLPTGGFRLSSTVGGAAETSDYADMASLQHALMDRFERFGMDPEKFGELQTNRAKTAAQIAADQARTKQIEILTPLQARSEQAQATSALASAGAAGALQREREATLAGQLEGQRLENEGRALQNAQIGKPPPAQAQQLSTIVGNVVPKQEVDLNGEPIPTTLTEPIIYGTATELGAAVPGMTSDQAVSMAVTLAQMPVSEWAAIPPVQEGQPITLPGGRQVPYSPGLHQALMNMARAAAAAEQSRTEP